MLRFISGLKELCERNLIETITPENVGGRLLMADEFCCESLKRAGMAYCEENANLITKNVAWKAMERVNPELFHNVTESIGSSQSMDEGDLSN